MSYIPLHCHSQNSKLDGVCTIKDMIKRCKEINVNKFALTDHGNGWGWTELLAETKKNDMIGLCGIEFYISGQLSTIFGGDNRKHTHLIMIAKNTLGYKQLVQMISKSNGLKNFYYNNRLSLEEIAGIIGPNKGNIIAITGHMGSVFGNVIIEEKDDVWSLRKDWKKDGLSMIEYLHNLFGQENVGIEIQTYHHGNGFDELVLYNRELCQITGAIPVATPDSHYAWRHQAELQRILLCIDKKKTLEEVKTKGADLSIFFETDKLYIPSREELLEWGNTDEELDNTIKITENCEPLDIFCSPKIPVAKIPKQFNKSIEYLSELCKQGFKERFSRDADLEFVKQVGERVKYELKDIDECGLTDYFLLIYKIKQWCNEQG